MRRSRFLGHFFSLAGLLLLLVLVLTGCGPKAVEQSDDFAYVINNTNEFARILRYNGEGAEVVIPETLGGKPVKEIASTTFAASPHVTSISIPASVTKIEDPSFYTLPSLSTITVAADCVGFIVQDGVLYHKQMKTVYCYPQGKEGDSFTLPDSVTTVGERAFYHSQLKELAMSKAVSKVYAYAFADSAGLASVAFSPALSQLYEGAFARCSSLADVQLPESLTSIGDDCFSGCSSLKALVVPAAVNVLKERVFLDCSALTNVQVRGSGIQRIAAETYKGCESLETVAYAAELMGIAERAFEGCKAFTGIALTDKLTVIGQDAFSGCEALAGIDLPASLTSIGARAFAGTAFLDSIPDDFAMVDGVLLAYRGAGADVTVPENVVCVSYLNADVVSVTVPEGVLAIADGAFENCAALQSISLPASLTSIGSRAFRNCSSLPSFTVPAGVTAIGAECFTGCASIESYAVDPANTTYLVDQGVLYDNMKKQLIWYPAASVMTSYAVPYGPKLITAGAFRGAQNLESLDTSAAVELWEVQNYAFADCPKLKSVKVHADFWIIGDYAFQGCTSLSDYDNTYRTKHIGQGAFQNCSSLAKLTLSQPLFEIGKDAFAGMTACTFTVFAATPGEDYVMGNGLPYQVSK